MRGDRSLAARLLHPRVPAPSERRRDIRHATVFQVAKLATLRGEELCILRDVSPGGLMAEIYCEACVGERVTITLRTEHSMAGTIAWVRDGAMGVQFDGEVPVLEMLAHCAVDERVGTIRPPRILVDLPARLTLDGELLDIRVCDVSQAGMKIEAGRDLAPGRPCTIDVPGLGRRRGLIRWQREAQAGVLLTQPLAYPDFRAWRVGLANAR